MRIAVDAMGGDQGPPVVVAGARQAARELRGEFDVVLVGQEDRIRPELGGDALEVVHAAEVVGMSDPAASAVRRKPDSSIAVAMRMVKDGSAQAFVSAGNTGAVVASSLVTLGRLRGVSRPAISTLWPTRKGGAVVLDVGANHECNSKNLLQFAIMGSVFARYNLGIDHPRVGLLNIGEERSKGNELVKDSYLLLEKESSINFVGNVEGRDVLYGGADVVVCDGFVGNIILKFSESIYAFLAHMVKEQIRKGFLAKAGALLMLPAFRSVRSQLDYASYGGAPLLGVNGVTIISHGKSSPVAIKNAILVAAKSLRGQVNMHIEEQFKDTEKNVASAN